MWHDIRINNDFPFDRRDVFFTDGFNMYVGYYNRDDEFWYSLGYVEQDEEDRYFVRDDLTVKAWRDCDWPEFFKRNR